MEKEEFYGQLGQFRKKAKGIIPPLDNSYKILNRTIELLFPILSSNYNSSITDEIDIIKTDLTKLLLEINFSIEDATSKSKSFIDSFPIVYQKLIEDANAIFNGDPAAESLEEVIATYPGFFAICVYRLAHELYILKISMLARIFSEYGHRNSGIDIHPGAQIGESFCIDHGTGIVIGETAIIGNNVKIYQGVTLGALSVSKKKANKKRHPTIEDNVTIYAGSTILGGRTIIGHDSTIGGNVWLVNSLEPFSMVVNKSEVSIKKQK